MTEIGDIVGRRKREEAEIGRERHGEDGKEKDEKVGEGEDVLPVDL